MRRLAIAAAVGIASLLVNGQTIHAAPILPNSATITAIASVPAPNTTSLFDVNNAGVSYSLGTNTSLLANGFDIRDLFGGTFGTNQYETGSAIFADNQPKGTVSSVIVTLPSEVSLHWFNLFLEDDGPNGNRSANEFMLYAGSTLIDDVHILDNTGTESYTSVYGSNFIEIDDFLNAAPASDTYTLSFVQNQDASSSSGIRATEFAASVPEPGAASLIVLTAGFLLRRKNRLSVVTHA